MSVIYWMLYKAGVVCPSFSPLCEEDFFSAVELERLAEMRFALRRNSFVLGRKAAKWMLLRIFAELETIPPHQISIENDPSGAPYARVNGNRLPGCLSISHSGDRAVCAYTENHTCIGVDLEEIQIRPRNFLMEYFTPAEIAEAEDLPLERQALWITAAWSAKEAVLKALGTGLRVDPRQVIVSFPEPDQFAIDKPGWMSFMIHKSPVTDYHWQGWWRVDENQVLTLAQARTNVFEKAPAIKEIRLCSDTEEDRQENL